MYDRIDEWLMSHVSEYDGKQFQDVARANLDLSGFEDKDEKEEIGKIEKDFKKLVQRVEKVIGEDVEEVRISHRLTDSPACLVFNEEEMGLQMRKILEAAGQSLPSAKRIFELNPKHPLVEKLNAEKDNARFESLTRVLYDQATLAEGGQLEDPAEYVHRLNRLLLELAG